MAACIDGVFRKNLQESILKCKVLLVGAGGIGCEILKNLVMTGFTDIEIIDLDTIDVSNLNRQFLFQREHVGKSKSAVARETALKFNPDVKIVSYHDSITSSEYGVSFFKRFSLVLNALDNRAARNHVNRVCLAADVPLVESGTSGYYGQVEFIKKGLTQCYECLPKAPQKTFPGCTIRNTPSEPIHCIVWSKHLFNQLFGEEDPDQDVSPDTADPEASHSELDENLLPKANVKGNIDRVSTRLWAQNCSYNPEKLFTKLFNEDIKYLLTMEALWKTRKPPIPLDWNNLQDAVAGTSTDNSDNQVLKDQQKWSMAKCAEVFADALKKLSKELNDKKMKNSNDHLVWDKDHESAMDFVAACSNIRSEIFRMSTKSRFDIKSMAGNIIPAIATTNAIIAGVVVLHGFRILQNNFNECKSVYLRPMPNPRNELLVPEKYLNEPNAKCYVCAPKPSAVLALDTTKMTIIELQELVLKKGLNMIEPDVMVDGKGIILISSDEGETEANNHKILADLDVKDGAILKVDDFCQNYSLTVTIIHREKPSGRAEGDDFIISADEKDLKPKETIVKQSNGDNSEAEPSTSNGQVSQVNNDDDDEDDIQEVAVGPDQQATKKKRKTEVPSVDSPSVKKRKTSDSPKKNNAADDDDDDCIIEDDVCIIKNVSNTEAVKKSPAKAPKRTRPSSDDEEVQIIPAVVPAKKPATIANSPAKKTVTIADSPAKKTATIADSPAKKPTTTAD